jgi:hypothetical protein
MQIQSIIFCKKDLSLRKAIIANRDLDTYGFRISEIQKVNRGRGNGWTKIVHINHDGSVNIRWNSNLQGLEIWTITRDTNPFPIYGAFIIFLSTFAKEIRSGSLCVS